MAYRPQTSTRFLLLVRAIILKSIYLISMKSIGR